MRKIVVVVVVVRIWFACNGLVMLMLSNEHYPFLFSLFGCNGIRNLFDLIEGSLFIWIKDNCFVINMFSYILTYIELHVA